MMQADAIIFDKDGTLIDFNAFWISLSQKAIEEALEKVGNGKTTVTQILEAFGVHDGMADPNGILCKGTYEEMGECVLRVLTQHGCAHSLDEVTRAVTDAYIKNADAGVVKPTSSQLVCTLGELKARGKRLAVVTTDIAAVTEKCLDALGIRELFDKIYTDDGQTPTKPDPYCLYDYCRCFGIDKSRVIMVGDTLTDVNFARNGGISVVGFASSDEGRALLSPLADEVISDMSELLDIIE